MAHIFPRNFGEICRLTKITTNLNHVKPCEYHNLKMSKRYIACTSKYFNLVCWKCGKERRKNIFCEHCRIIQKPSETENYFSIFELKEKFNLDQVQLTNKFRQLQNLVHPDKFSNKSYEEKIISEEYSSLLNKAYSYLQTPLKRAEYLLKLNGRAISESETIDEPAFLMNMMTLNEEVEDARNNADLLVSLNETNKKELAKLIQNLDDCFNKKDLLEVQKHLIKMKYFTSLGDRINKYLRDMGVTD